MFCFFFLSITNKFSLECFFFFFFFTVTNDVYFVWKQLRIKYIFVQKTKFYSIGNDLCIKFSGIIAITFFMCYNKVEICYYVRCTNFWLIFEKNHKTTHFGHFINRHKTFEGVESSSSIATISTYIRYTTKKGGGDLYSKYLSSFSSPTNDEPNTY